MPINELVKSWADDLAAQGVDRTTLDALLKELESKETAAEFIKGSQLRQQDYDRNLNRLKDEHKQKLDTIQQQQKTLQETIDAWNTSKNAYDDESKRLKEYTESLTSSNVSGGNTTAPSGDDLENLDEPVKKVAAQIAQLQEQIKSNAITKDDLARLKQEMADEMTSKFWKEGLPAAVNASVTESEIAMRHQREFGEQFNREDLMKFVKDSGVTFPSVSKAYDYYVAQRRQEKSAAETLKKEVDAAAQRAREDERAKLTQARATVPGVTPPGNNGWHDKSRQLDAETAKTLEGVKLGYNNNKLVEAMANDLLKQGKSIFTIGLEGHLNQGQ